MTLGRFVAIAMAVIMVAGGVSATSQNVKVGEVDAENHLAMEGRGQKTT